MTKTTVGNYRIVRELGVGGMGAVYEAVDLMLERPVAIKVLRAEIARQPELIERFRVEAVTLAKLNHPAIATLYNFFREEDDYYMVMEFVRGRTLEDLIEKKQRLSAEEAVDILGPALEGMAHAHGLGVLHRDIKPANIMIADDGAVKVTDFGIARILGSSRLTREGRIIGTLEYIAPERVKGEEADARSDVYSAGVVLFEALAGRLPFIADTDLGTIEAQLHQSPPTFGELSVNCPADLEAAVRRALEKQPSRRFQSAEEFRAAIAGVDLGTVAMKPTRLAGYTPGLRETRLAASPGMRKWRLPLLGALGVALLAISIVLSGVARRQSVATIEKASSAPVSAPAPLPPPPVAEPVPPPTEPPPLQGGLTGAEPSVAVADNSAASATGNTITLGQSAVPAAGARGIRAIRTMYVAAMPNHLDDYIRAEIGKQLAGRLSVAASRENCDAVMTGTDRKKGGSASRFTSGYLGTKNEFTGTVTITDPSGTRVLWTSAAGDREVLIGVLKRGGPKRVAERLVSKLRKAMTKK